LRLVGPESGRLATELGELAPSVEASPVHDVGYVELRRYVVEQSRSVAKHRHGNMSYELALAGARSRKRAT
jgi:hypothetical protein